ncbi:MAG TPA: hypothetical protein VFD36_28345, partial [Kofleriaceae bacterium]|nr:hypothetical protein [Kofleriaceae bacterium]
RDQVPAVEIPARTEDRPTVALERAERAAAVWDRASLERIAELPHGAKLRSAMFGPDGSTALTTDDAGRARIWQLPDGAAIATLAAGTTAATYAPGGGVITAGDGKVRFWTAAGREVGSVALDYTADRLVLDPDGRWLFVRGATTSLLVIDVAARAAATRLAIVDRRVHSIVADAARVAITDGAAIRMWRLGTWVPLDTLAGHKAEVTGLWFGSAGRLVSASGDATLVWGADARIAGKLADNNLVFALAPTPDGALFATTGTDGEIRIWDSASSHLLLQLPAHRLPAFTLRLTHDGTTAISGGDDGRLVTWDLTRRARSAAELAEIVRCRVPLRLEGNVALPRDLDYSDPTCRSPSVDR